MLRANSFSSLQLNKHTKIIGQDKISLEGIIFTQQDEPK